MNALRTQRISEGVLCHKATFRQNPPTPVSFTAAANTQTMTLLGIPANHLVIGVRTRLVVPFTAFGLTSCVVTVGTTSILDGSVTSPNYYLPSFECTATLNEKIFLGPVGIIDVGSGQNNIFGSNLDTVVNESTLPLYSVPNYFAGALITVVSEGASVGYQTTVVSSSANTQTGVTTFIVGLSSNNPPPGSAVLITKGQTIVGPLLVTSVIDEETYQVQQESSFVTLAGTSNFYDGYSFNNVKLPFFFYGEGSVGTSTPFVDSMTPITIGLAEIAFGNFGSFGPPLVGDHIILSNGDASLEGSAQQTDTSFEFWSPLAMYTTDPQNITVTFTSSGAQLSTLTAGEIEFTVLYRPV